MIQVFRVGQANHEVRKQIRKQHSLPDSGEPKRYRTLRESFMTAVKKAPTFENFKNTFSLFRVPEEDGATVANKNESVDENETVRAASAKVKAASAKVKAAS